MADRTEQQLGNYRLVRLLGQGGFAEVYLGEHIYLGTEAAIKLLYTQLAGEDLTTFLTEARTVARLEHPHIVRVLEFGIEGTVPFLVMSYAPNGSLRQRHPTGTRLPLETLLSYVKQVAEALQYAHDEKLMHRDIKPENMLLGRRQDVLLSDFGIALVAQSTRMQSVQEVVGTVAYMAPEMLQGKPRLASDQYALGIVVYEWLCGERPFHGGFTELASQHLFVAPPSLREKMPFLAPEIEQVVMTALAKDPHQRFGSVQAFATALEQACQIPAETIPVVQLVPPTTEATLLRSSQQSTELVTQPSESSIPTELVAPSIQSALPTVSLSPTSQPSSLPTEGAKQPSQSEQFTEKPLPLVLTPAPQEVASSQHSRAQTSDQPVVGQEADEETSYQPVAGRVVDYDQSQLVQGNALTMFYHGLLSSSSHVYLHWGKNGWQDVVTGDEPMTKRPDGFWQARITIPIDATQMNLAFHDGSDRWDNNGSKNWNLAIRDVQKTKGQMPAQPAGTVLFTYHGHSKSVTAVAWSPDGTRIASASDDQTVQVWDAATGKTLSTHRDHAKTVTAVAWSPDGRRIASGSKDKTVQVWDTTTGKTLLTYRGHSTWLNSVASVAWSPDGTRIVSGSSNPGIEPAVRIWDVATGGTLGGYAGHGTSGVSAVAWSPDGTHIASAGGDVQVWDAATRKPLLTYDHMEAVLAVAWSPDSTHIVSGGRVRKVKVWDATTGKTHLTYGHSGWILQPFVLAVAWSPDGTRIASGSDDKTVQVWDAATGKTLYIHRNHAKTVTAVAWAPDGTRIASAGDDNTVQVWQTP